MNSAPWWFTLVTAVGGAGIALAANLITTAANNRRADQRLEHQLETQREIEAGKRQHDRGLERDKQLVALCLSAPNVLSRCMTALSHASIEWQDSHTVDDQSLDQIVVEIGKVQELMEQAKVLAAPDTTEFFLLFCAQARTFPYYFGARSLGMETSVRPGTVYRRCFDTRKKILAKLREELETGFLKAPDAETVAT